ncbi:hypothetical protein J3Q00_20445 [Pseudomonas sp. D2-3]
MNRKYCWQRVFVAIAFFSLISIYVLAFWKWQLGIAVEMPSMYPVAEAATQDLKIDYIKLAQMFGSTKAETAVAPVKESTLSLKLVASYVGGKGRSAAVIASSESNHKLYYQGDTLLPGVELVTVQARRVLIKRNGMLESVSLEDSRQPATSRPQVAAVASQPVAVVPVSEPISQQKLADKLNKLKALASGEM